MFTAIILSAALLVQPMPAMTVAQVAENTYAKPYVMERPNPNKSKYPKPPKLTRKYGHKDMRGYRKSVYRGKYYAKSQEGFRKCVMWRESRNRYGARNHPSVSSAAGAYQFLDYSWRRPLPWMLNKENIKIYGPKQAKKIRTTLQSTPIEKWARPWQDQAFFTVLNYNGTWSGKKHWAPTVPGTGC